MARSSHLFRLLAVLLCFAVFLQLCSSLSAFARTGEAGTVVATRAMTDKDALKHAVRSYRYTETIDWSVSCSYADQLATEDQRFFYDSFLTVTPSTGKIEHPSDSFEPIPVSAYQADPEQWKARILEYAADQIVSAYAAFSFDKPELSFWSSGISYGYSLKASSVSGVPYYYLTLSAQVKVLEEFANKDVSAMTAELEEKVRDLSSTSSTQTSLSRYEILKDIHDNLCNALVYNVNDPYCHSAYSIVTGQAVCEGYAKGIKMLCDRYQIPCMIVTGTGVTSKGKQSHAWNVVRMENGEWYGLDATWDDQSTIYRDFFLAGSATVPEHFLQMAFSASHIEEEDWNGSQSVFLQYPALATEQYKSQTGTHEYGSWIPEVPATCTKAGTKGHYHCMHCGGNFNENYVQLDTLTIKALGHDYEPVYTPPTATSNGYTTYTCKRCKDVTVVYDDPDTTLKGTVGDINQDDEVNAIDYILLKKFVLGALQLSDSQLALADINGDGEIDAVDYILLKKRILNG